MSWKSFLHDLIPQESEYFDLLEKSAANLTAVGNQVAAMTAGREPLEVAARQVKDLEHQGDQITRAIFDRLNRTFLTPLDREDIHELASALDDAVDQIDSVIHKQAMYQLRELSAPMKEAMRLFGAATLEVEKAVKMLRRLNKGAELSGLFRRLHELEEEGDQVFSGAIVELFKHQENPVELIKIKDVLEGLERAIDRTYQISNIIEGIAIKNA